MSIYNIGTNADPDFPLAQALQQKFGGEIIRGLIDINTLNQNLVILGGQIASETYNSLINMGLVPSLRESTTDFGSIFYFKHNNMHNVWVLAGWSFQGTSTAVSWVLDKGFPTVDRVIPFTDNAEVIQLYFPNATQFGMQSLNNIKNSVVNYANKFGANIQDSWVDIDGKNFFMLRKISQVQATVAPLVIAAIIIAIGALVLGFYFVYTIRAEHADNAKIPENIKDLCFSFINEADRLKCVQISYENIVKILETEKKGFLDDIRNILIVAVVGLGIFAAYKIITDIRKK
ncbi:MAG: hypothetical protein AABY22_11320 [Nanoarchaeota archaeon]